MKSIYIFPLVGLLVSLSSPVTAKQAIPSAVILIPSVTLENTPSSEIRHIPLAKQSAQRVMQLRGTEGQSSVDFNVRKDELVTKASVNLHYTYSPALLPNLSHIKVMLNDEVIGILPISKDNAGKSLDYQVEINPRLLIDFNRLKLQLIGHYTNDCEDPLHSSLWADISGNSELELTVQKLAVINDLSLLPEPFFDRRDNARLNLPFVFSAHPSLPTLRAAGVTASWFGQLAGWRKARFPANLDRLTVGHAIVFATNDERPDFLKKLPPFSGPSLSIMTNPVDNRSKLLLILGRDGNDLRLATTALVLGNAVLSGTQAVVTGINEGAPRQAYDAPKWVRLDRPMKFGELIESPQELQASGHNPSPIRISLRVPPDLFTWHSNGVTVDLKYRYTPPVNIGESNLNMSVNNELVHSFRLRPAGTGSESARMQLPLLSDALFGENRDVLIPSFKMNIRNELQYTFSFITYKEGLCSNGVNDSVRSVIDADSTIDFSGYPHYSEMPNLNYFVALGFPFTKFADLSQTVVVLPEFPVSQDIEVFLTVLGHMGEATGYPSTRFNLVNPKDEAKLKDSDILVIGSAMQQSLLKKWGDQLPVTINGTSIKTSQPKLAVSFLYDWLGFQTKPQAEVASQEQINSDGSLAAIIGFESPLSSTRSVVAITAVAPEHLPQILDALDNDAQTDRMQGSVIFVRGNKVDSELVGNTYFIGRLPFWAALWYPISKHPYLLVLMAVLTVLIFAFALWRSLKAIARRRLHQVK